MTHLFHDSLHAARPASPVQPLPLRFSPTAWAKLLYWRDRANSAVGAWGLSHPDDFLQVVDVRLVRQTSSLISVELEDPAELVGLDSRIGAGQSIERTNRIWILLHAESSSQPTAHHEQVFQRALGGADWGVLCIIGRLEVLYARLQFFAGPGGSCLLPVGLQFGEPFAGSDYAAWDREYQANVTIQSCFRHPAWSADLNLPHAASRDWQAEWEAHVRSTPQASLELEGLAPQQPSRLAAEACDATC